MKKFLICAVAVCMLAFGALAFTACDEGENEGAVTLVNIANPSTGISAAADFDYMVAAEPVVSAKVKGTASAPEGSRLVVVGNLQELYGEGGYPQAVVVVKNSLIQSDPALVASFAEAIAASCAWVNEGSVDIAAVVDAVSSHRGGADPTFSAANLTAQVIENCAIGYTSAAESKEDVTAFLSKLAGVGTQKQVSEEFFYTPAQPAADASDASAVIDVVMPDGAPALSMAKLLADEAQFGCTVRYSVVAPTAIQTYVTGNDPAAEICVMPVNAAANLLGDGSNYRMIATVTHGNIYFLSAKHPGVQLTKENLSELAGKRVGCIQLENVVGQTLRAVLKDGGVEYKIAE